MTKLFDLLPGWAWALALAGALSFGWWQYDGKRDLQVALARVDADLKQQKIDAGKKLLEETNRANDAERNLQTTRAALETLSGQHREISGAYSRALADLTLAESGRLRDPKATGCRNSGSHTPAPVSAPANDSAGNTTETGGLLSESLSGLLRSEADANDKINDAYAACRPWALEVDRLIKQYNLERK